MDAVVRSFNAAGLASTNLMRHAVTRGIEVYAAATLTEPDGTAAPLIVSRWDADEAVTAASMNKLAIALWALETYAYEGYDALKTWSDDDRRPGAGTFDKPDAPLCAPVIDLVDDMLANSGNTAMAVLGRYDFHIVNAMLRRRKYAVTRLAAVGTEGRFETGVTTPEESLCLLWEILAFMPLSPLVRTVRSALARSTTHLSQVTDGGHWSKHGDLNPDSDSDEYVRHEAGFIERSNYFIGYSVFTRCTGMLPLVGRHRAHFADRVIGRIGDNFAAVLSVAPRHAGIVTAH